MVPAEPKPRLRILGARGIPASYGGFETFAQDLALYLVARGWDVIVYCQDDGGEAVREETWRGIRLIHIPVRSEGAKGSIAFDWKSTWHASREPDLVLNLGYNTALFFLILRCRGVRNVVNFGGIDWTRRKWSLPVRVWFYVNHLFACWCSNHLVADHPRIQDFLESRPFVCPRKITMIPYGAEPVDGSDRDVLAKLGLVADRYVFVIARSEPGHSLIDIMEAWSRREREEVLVVVGPYHPEKNRFHRRVMAAASDSVRFLGAVFDQQIVQTLRAGARLYIHGHHHGGTNPSLVEALAASSAVLAHDNPFNRWVATEDAAEFFSGPDACAAALDRLLTDDARLEAMRKAARARFEAAFTQDIILGAYEELLRAWLPGGS
ncbi:MAG: glycosyl transferase [Planctomycetes bacterium]|nr:glycosyl transferase [Planctomycetota bacterium]